MESATFCTVNKDSSHPCADDIKNWTKEIESKTHVAKSAETSCSGETHTISESS